VAESCAMGLRAVAVLNFLPRWVFVTTWGESGFIYLASFVQESLDSVPSCLEMPLFFQVSRVGGIAIANRGSTYATNFVFFWWVFSDEEWLVFEAEHT